MKTPKMFIVINYNVYLTIDSFSLIILKNAIDTNYAKIYQ